MNDEVIEKRRAACRAWYHRNKDRERLRSKLKHKKYKIECPDHLKELARARYRKNPQIFAKRRDEWRKRYPLKAAIASTNYGRKWKSRNLQKSRELGEQYRKRNLHKFREKQARRRSKIKSSMPKWANQFFIREIYHLAQ